MYIMQCACHATYSKCNGMIYIECMWNFLIQINSISHDDKCEDTSCRSFSFMPCFCCCCCVYFSGGIFLPCNSFLRWLRSVDWRRKIIKTNSFWCLPVAIYWWRWNDAIIHTLIMYNRVTDEYIGKTALISTIIYSSEVVVKRSTSVVQKAYSFGAQWRRKIF